jgi:flagellar biosynthetic protein FliR
MTDFTLNQIELFMLVFVRLVTMLLVIPIFSQRSLPTQYRAALAFFLAILISPILLPSFKPLEVTNVLQFGWLVIKEVMIGLSIGYMTLSLFAGVGFAGNIVDMQMGFSMLSLPNPINPGSMLTASGMMQTLILSIVFLALNGHYFLFLAIEKSFHIVPPGQVVFPAETVATMAVETLIRIYEVAIRIAAPVLIVLLVTSITLGIVAKTMPQMNIFFVGMPLKIGVGFITLIFALPVVVKIFESVLHQLYEDIWILLTQMAL